VADEAQVLSVQRSTIEEGACTDERVGHRKRPRARALPVADEAQVLSVQRSTIDAGVRAKERVGHRKRKQVDPTAHKKPHYRSSEVNMLALPIFPGSRPPSIVGADVLNFCVRDGLSPPAPPGADAAGGLSVQRSTIDAGVRAKERVGHRNRKQVDRSPVLI